MYRVRNNRRERPVTEPESGIVLQGTRTLSDEDMAKLMKHQAIREMLGFDEKTWLFAGSELLTVTKLEDEKADPGDEEKTKASKRASP